MEFFNELRQNYQGVTTEKLKGLQKFSRNQMRVYKKHMLVCVDSSQRHFHWASSYPLLVYHIGERFEASFEGCNADEPRTTYIWSKFSHYRRGLSSICQQSKWSNQDFISINHHRLQHPLQKYRRLQKSITSIILGHRLYKCQLLALWRIWSFEKGLSRFEDPNTSAFKAIVLHTLSWD